MEVKELSVTTSTDTTTPQYTVLNPDHGATLIIETDADIRMAINSNAAANFTTYSAMRCPYYIPGNREVFNKLYIKSVSGAANVTIRHCI